MQQQQQHNNYKAIASKGYAKVKRWMEEKPEDGWSPLEYPGDRSIALWEKDEDAAVYVLRARGFLEGVDAPALVARLTDCDEERRLQWDGEDLKHIERVERLDEHCSIVWFHVYTPLGIAERDLVNVELVWHRPGSDLWWIITHHVEHDAKPPDPTGKVVRAQQISGVRLRNTSHGCECSIVSWVRPNGVIPASAAKLYKTKLGDRLVMLGKK